MIDEEYPRGLNVAVGLGTTSGSVAGRRRVCTLLSDIPLVTGEDIDAVFAATAPGRAGVMLVPSTDLTGTNMMTRMPPDVIPTRFGRMSLTRHLDDCRARGALRDGADGATGARSGRDARLDRIRRMPSMTHTFGQLSRLGVIHG